MLLCSLFLLRRHCIPTLFFFPPRKSSPRGITFIHRSRVKSTKKKYGINSVVRLCIPFIWRVKGLWEWSEETDVDPGTNRAGGRGEEEEEEEKMGGCYTPTAFPLTCVGGRAGSGLRGVPAAPGWGGRGASAELPLTLMCSHPPWRVT